MTDAGEACAEEGFGQLPGQPSCRSVVRSPWSSRAPEPAPHKPPLSGTAAPQWCRYLQPAFGTPCGVRASAS